MTQRNRTLAIVGGAVLVVLLVLGIALIASGGGDDGDSADTDSTEAPADSPDSGDSDSGDADSGDSDSGDSDSGDADSGDADSGDESPDGEDPGAESGGETRPVTVTGAQLPPLEDPDADPAVGTAAPILDGEDFDGTAITIGEPSDGPTMVVFLAHWCPHCNAEIPELIALDEAGRLPDDLNVVGVSTAANPEGENYPPSEWIVEKGWPWPIMVDDDEVAAIIAYGGTGFPFTVMLDEDGVVLARKSGSGSADEIEDWINTVLG